MQPRAAEGWHARARRMRAARALARQLDYQEQKASKVAGREAEYTAGMLRRSTRARALLEDVRPIDENARVLEIGSGA
ncbi:MAG: hypothetical protein WCD76_05410, partial [Pyrinomonadaceae bacterium]